MDKMFVITHGNGPWKQYRTKIYIGIVHEIKNSRMYGYWIYFGKTYTSPWWKFCRLKPLYGSLLISEKKFSIGNLNG